MSGDPIDGHVHGGAPVTHPAAPDQQHIWDYFQTESHAHFAGGRGRVAWIAKHLQAGEKVLDIGVGAGTLEAMALARGVDVHCLDPSQPSIEDVRARLGLGEKAKVGLAQEIPWADGTFDVVVVSEILEHLPDDVLERAVGEAARVLVPGGRLVGTVPAREDLRENVVICPCCSARFHRWGHWQSFDIERMTGLLARHLRVERMVSRPFVTWSELDWQGVLHASARFAFRAVGIHGKNENLAFVAVKPPAGRP